MRFEDQFRAVMAWQLGPTKSLECPECPEPMRSQFPLVPWVTEDGFIGLICPLGCGHTQDWVPQSVLSYYEIQLRNNKARYSTIQIQYNQDIRDQYELGN